MKQVSFFIKESRCDISKNRMFIQNIENKTIFCHINDETVLDHSINRTNAPLHTRDFKLYMFTYVILPNEDNLSEDAIIELIKTKAVQKNSIIDKIAKNKFEVSLNQYRKKGSKDKEFNQDFNKKMLSCLQEGFYYSYNPKSYENTMYCSKADIERVLQVLSVAKEEKSELDL